MLSLIRNAFDDRSSELRHRLSVLYALLIAVNLGIWGWALYLFRDHPVMLGTALLAYSFGLRHAVDADHIAAIDNVTRRRASGRSAWASGSRSVIPPWWCWRHWRLR